MKSELEKLKKELLNWSDYHTDIEILEMNREKYEKVFNYFKKANFKIRAPLKIDCKGGVEPVQGRISA